MIKVDIVKKMKFESSQELTIRHEFPENEITGIYGRSGAGKTTLLKIIAGLTTPDQGTIEVNDHTWFNTDRKINIPVQQRHIGFVFQDYALFPNMTVKQNLFYAAGKHPDEKHIAHLLKITALENFVDIKPDALSGGQKQRTAFARALVRKPSLLLLDEPLSATDAQTRAELQQQLLHLQQQYKFTALLVSHDKEELRRLTKHILHIDNGQIIQTGTSERIFNDKDQNFSLTGIVSGLSDGWIEVSVQNQTYKLKNDQHLHIGEEVKITINLNDALIEKR